MCWRERDDVFNLSCVSHRAPTHTTATTLHCLTTLHRLLLTVKVGFHYPSWRPEFTGVKYAPEFSGRQLGPWTRVVENDLNCMVETLRHRHTDRGRTTRRHKQCQCLCLLVIWAVAVAAAPTNTTNRNVTSITRRGQTSSLSATVSVITLITNVYLYWSVFTDQSYHCLTVFFTLWSPALA